MKKDLLNDFMNGQGNSKKQKSLLGNMSMKHTNPINNIMGTKQKSNISDLMINLNNNKPMGLLKSNMGGFMMKKSAPNVSDLMINTNNKNNVNGLFMKRKKSNIKDLMISTKPKSGLNSIMVKPMNPLGNLMPLMNNNRKGNIVGDMITTKQKRYLKKHKGVDRFGDFDNDGVINGLDCEPFNPNAHGFFTKAKNLVRGDGFKEDEEIIEFEDQVPQKNSEMQWQKDKIDKKIEYENQAWGAMKKLINKGATYEDITNIAGSKDKEKFIQNDPKLSKLYKDPEIEEEMLKRDKAKAEYEMASAKADKLDQSFDKAKKDFLQEDYEKTRAKQDEQIIKEREEQRNKSYEELQQQRQQQALEAEEKATQKQEKKLDLDIKLDNLKTHATEFIKDKAMDRGFYDYDVKQTFVDGKPVVYTKKKFSLAGPLKAATGYAFEQKEARASYKDDLRRERLENAKNIIGPTKYASILKKNINGKPMSKQDQETFILREAKNQLKAKERALREEKQLEPVKREQLRMQLLDARRKIETSKYNIGQMQSMQQANQSMQMNQALSGPSQGFGMVRGFVSGWQPQPSYLRDTRYNNYDVNNYTRRMGRGAVDPNWSRQTVSNDWVGSDGIRQPNERILPKNRLNGDVEGTLRDVMSRPNISEYDKMDQQYRMMSLLNSQRQPILIPQEDRPYDPEKPRFVYRKNIKSFTRKSSRLKPGKDPKIGDISEPSREKRASSLYPWTNPMPGWERVYIGKGDYTGKGAPYRGSSYKKQPSYNKTKGVKKFNFVPYARTYAIKQIRKDQKKSENNLS